VRSPTKPWYRASKDAWYVQFNGRKVRLAKGRDNEKAAQQAFYKLMASGSGKLPEADTLHLATVCDLISTWPTPGAVGWRPAPASGAATC
jgi:hypothetical protein